MKRILITGALGQIGSELAHYLAKEYGKDNIIATGRSHRNIEALGDLHFEMLDVSDGERLNELVEKNKIDTIVHLAAILSAKGETMPQETWHTNMGGLQNVLEVAKNTGAAVFTPSSIAVFGKDFPLDNTPQSTVMLPTTMYGVTKVSGEILADYYHQKFGVDARGVRYPGIISHLTLPGNGTTDYAVHIYYEAVKNNKYTSYIAKDTYMDMLYMPDALRAVVELMEANPDKLIHRNAFNITAMSLEPEKIAAAIRKHYPEFALDYAIDPVRQAIAESWPNSLDDTCAREEWGWHAEYDLPAMTADMLENLEKKLK
ncbi:MAG: NAD-dependent epimerase/dehydratase family protein [Tissierellia bacterium]|jgi:nucleoside-diphosphate-sugar epimerase|nr:NAD-dependent epimerase/dehydratase family protein [Bacillota bacterium]NLK58855.1 NAD-dependent epimerase/dehydratase family protein [Tissierellia bacterium]